MDVASAGKHSIVQACAQGIHLDLEDSASCLRRIHQYHQQFPVDAILGTDETSVELAAKMSRHLDLGKSNPPKALQITRRKDLARQIQKQHGLKVPNFSVIPLNQDGPPPFGFPMVLKPLSLSASRGVIRVNDVTEFSQAKLRIRSILSQIQNLPQYEQEHVLGESYIPGREIAFDGLLQDGELIDLAIFDKPDPLEGPFFEETYYISPSRLKQQQRRQLLQTVQRTCQAYGLKEGPVHAECRINQEGIWLLEVAARTIGGLCSRIFEYTLQCSLEELVIRHALSLPLPQATAEGAAGILMIPIPQAGMLHRVRGIPQARAVPLIEDVDIYIQPGNELVPLPEGASYLGFIFARGDDPQRVESALRQAHDLLNIEIKPIWKLHWQQQK